MLAAVIQLRHMQTSMYSLNDMSAMLASVAIVAMICKHMLGSKIVKEDVTVIKNFGVQMYSYNLSGKVCGHRFVDLARVRDVILNESMSYWQLDQYVAFVCEREKALVVLFASLKIR